MKKANHVLCSKTCTLNKNQGDPRIKSPCFVRALLFEFSCKSISYKSLPLIRGEKIFFGGGSYLLNFCRQWYVCKFHILGDLSNHLFGLVFPCPTSEKIRVGVHWTPLYSIKVGFFKNFVS